MVRGVDWVSFSSASNTQKAVTKWASLLPRFVAVQAAWLRQADWSLFVSGAPNPEPAPQALFIPYFPYFPLFLYFAP